jgi:hypothetical protein
MLFPMPLITILTVSTIVLATPVSDLNPSLAADTLASRANEYLGGIDLDSACRDQWFRFAFLVQSGNSCNAWTCSEFIEYNISGLGINMGEVCAKTYGNGVYAWCEKGAYDWGCYRA